MIQNFISKLSPKEKKIFYIAMLFILLAVFDRLFLGPSTAKLKSLDEEIEKEKNWIKSDLRFLSYKDRILRENITLSPYYTSKAQTEEEVIAAFLKRIEILATASKVNLIKVNPSEINPKIGYIEFNANLECDGRLDDIVTFMHAIDTSKELLKIVKLSMTPKRGSAEEVSCAMTVTKVIIDLASVKEAEKVLREASSGAGDSSGGPQSEDEAAKKGGDETQAPESSQPLSERFAVKGFKTGKEDSTRKSKEEEETEIKPSVFEKLMGKIKK